MPAPKYRRCITPEPQPDGVLLMKWTGEDPDNLHIWTNDPMWVEFFHRYQKAKSQKTAPRQLGRIRGVRKNQLVDAYVVLPLPLFGGVFRLYRPKHTTRNWYKTAAKMVEARKRMAWAQQFRKNKHVPKTTAAPPQEDTLLNEITAILAEETANGTAR